ncbi:hypothetical protein Fmac_003039 [Flemingia macrophylla]|uniref:DUF1262 family protein n=1 Tax=Flemingia macrophylla TaxID=520843 RepID=A0ABD1NLM9_9FABA
MYVTKPLSLYKRDPGALSEAPPAGPSSGYLVIFDEDAQTYSCFGLAKDNSITDLPFPQNKNLTVNYSSDDEEDLFVPVLNQPLSSNRYYVIRRKGRHRGHFGPTNHEHHAVELSIPVLEEIMFIFTEHGRVRELQLCSALHQASTSSKEEDMDTCLCCSFVQDVKPRPLDPSDAYQQVEIMKSSYGFQAKSIAVDGIPSGLLRRKGWTVHARTPTDYHLHEALGSDDSLRAKLPDFNNFPLFNERSESVVVGKWYCPFMFVKERMRVKEQMKKSVFYELTLEQRWEKIFSKEGEGGGENHGVFVDVVVQTEGAKVEGREAAWDDGGDDERVVWFKSVGGVASDNSETLSIGLSLEIVNGMKWEQERVGWIGGNERKLRVERVEEFGGGNRWRKFGCYVLVESFLLKRMDRRPVLSDSLKLRSNSSYIQIQSGSDI